MLEHAGLRARVLGRDINTDYLISSRRKRESLDPLVLARHLLEDLDPAFAATVLPGDVLVAGPNFGCGSAMEVAATVVLGAGIPAVIAPSFSRTYFRNAVNNGLLPVIADTSGIAEGDRLSIVQQGGRLAVRLEPSGELRQVEPLGPVVTRILEAGGLISYVARHGSLPA